MNICELWYLMPNFSHKTCRCYQTKNLVSKNLKVIVVLMWIFLILIILNIYGFIMILFLFVRATLSIYSSYVSIRVCYSSSCWFIGGKFQYISLSYRAYFSCHALIYNIKLNAKLLKKMYRFIFFLNKIAV